MVKTFLMIILGIGKQKENWRKTKGGNPNQTKHINEDENDFGSKSVRNV